MTIQVPERQRVSIIALFPGSPAEAAGLQPHDSILEADGKPIMDENGFHNDLLVGKEGTNVTSDRTNSRSGATPGDGDPPAHQRANTGTLPGA